MTRSPATSPSHHVVQIAPYFAHSAKPLSARLVTPTAGLIAALAMAASANIKTPCGRSKTPVPPANRVISHTPQTASSVLPVAMHNDVVTSPAVVTFTKNAPINIAGQVRYPSTSMAARVDSRMRFIWVLPGRSIAVVRSSWRTRRSVPGGARTAEGSPERPEVFLNAAYHRCGCDAAPRYSETC